MMNNFIGAYTYCNGLKKVEEVPDCEPDELFIYEVIRIIDYIPLFLYDHISRLENSLSIKKYQQLFSKNELIKSVFDVIDNNQISMGNIKMGLILKKSPLLVCGFIPHKYPTSKDYEKGVSLGILNAIRNSPNVKAFNQALRASADNIISKYGLYEVLLVNKNKEITEGSRSNIFFIKDNNIFTPPANEVLEGITRKKIINICRELDVFVKEQTIKQSNISCFDAAFITGTSPKILPVREINDNKYSTHHPLLRSLMMAYDEKIKNNLKLISMNFPS